MLPNIQNALSLVSSLKDQLKQIEREHAVPAFRKLAHIEEVTELLPIEGADRIEVAKILGWMCVVKKGEFKPGDLCIYIEIDSRLPETNPVFDFMKDKGYKVKSCRFRGQISQGLALPVKELFPNLFLKVGMNVTDLLGIVHIQMDSDLTGDIIGVFPSHIIPKTDELRIQSFPGMIQELQGKPYVITHKIDGTSCTIFNHNGQFGVCSRNNMVSKTTAGNKLNAYWYPVEVYDLERKLSGVNLALQGELAGPGIQGNKLNLPSKTWYIFDIYDIDKQRYFSHDEIREYCQEKELTPVPLLGIGDSFNWTLDEIIAYASSLDTKGELFDKIIEGIVVRSLEYMFSSTIGKRLSFKVINNNYV